MKPVILAVVALALLPACGAEDAANPPEAVSTPEESHTETAIDPYAATGFITPGTPVPDFVEFEEGAVPRDSYGRPFAYAYLGETLPAFSGPLVSGGTFTSDQLLGQWTVIDVWGLWCSDCMKDAEMVAALSRAIDQDPDLAFLSIHTPLSSRRLDRSFGKYDSVQAYFDEKGYAYPTLIDSDAAISEGLQIAWTPSYLLVDPDGVVQGFRSELSAAGGEPVKDFLKDIAAVKAGMP